MKPPEKTDSIYTEIFCEGSRRELQVVGYLWDHPIDNRFPTRFNATIKNVDSFYILHTPGGWRPYERELPRMRDKQHLIDLVGEVIVAYYE